MIHYNKTTTSVREFIYNSFSQHIQAALSAKILSPRSNTFVFGARVVRKVIINMYERPLHFRQVFQFLLQSFPNVVRKSQIHRLRQNDVYLNKKVVAKMEGANGCNVADVGVMVQCDPRNFGKKVWSGCVTGQQFDLIWK